MKKNRKWFAAALCLGAFAISGCKGKAPETVADPEPQPAPVVEELFGLDAVRQPGAKVCVDPYVVDVVVRVLMENAMKGVVATRGKGSEFESQLKYSLDTSTALLTSVDNEIQKTTCSATFHLESMSRLWDIPLVYSAQVAASQTDFVVEVNNISVVSNALAGASFGFEADKKREVMPTYGVEFQPSDEEKWAARPQETDLAEKSTEQPTSEPSD